MNVVIAHDWMVSYAGSERVVEEMLRLFPAATVLTTLRNDAVLPARLRHADTSFLQHVPSAMTHHEWYLPLMLASWQLRRRIDDADIVISSSHACAKSVRVGVGIPHLCYCHTPMRYAWDFDIEAGRIAPPLRPLARRMMTLFRRIDVRSSLRVDRFVANSSAVAGRIRRCYGRDSIVVHPPVRTDFFTPGSDRRGDYFLYVGRLTGYKRPDLVVEAFRGLPHELVVVGAGPMKPRLERTAPSNVRFVGAVDDPELRAFYRSAHALVYPIEEDFGIAMAEAQACGTPVIGLARGGALDIVAHEQTGWLVGTQELDDIRAAVMSVAAHDFDHETIAARAERFSVARFHAALSAAVEATVDAATPSNGDF